MVVSAKKTAHKFCVILLIEVLILTTVICEVNRKTIIDREDNENIVITPIDNNQQPINNNQLLRDATEKQFTLQTGNLTNYLLTNDSVILNDVNSVFDLKMVADSNDNMHVVLLGQVDGINGLYHKVLFKSNQSWSDLLHLGSAIGDNYASTIDLVAGWNSTIHLTYYLSSGVHYRRYSNGAWEDPVFINGGVKPKIQLGLDGLPKIFYYYEVWYDGFTYDSWLAEQLINGSWIINGFFNSLRFYDIYYYDFVVTAKDNLEMVYIYICRVSSGHHFELITKSNISSEFSDPVFIASYETDKYSNYKPIEAELVVDNSGILHFIANIPSDTENYFYYQRSSGGAWTTPSIIVSKSTTNYNIRVYKTCAVEPSNNIAFVWSHLDYLPPHIPACNLGLKTYRPTTGWSEAEFFSNVTTVSRFPSLAFDSIGDFHLVWFEMKDDEATIHYQFGYGDGDGDGLLNKDELEIYGTDPFDPDTDDDQFLDGEEIDLGFDPLNPDEDSDLMLDGWEYHHDLNPYVNDSYDDLDVDLLFNIEELWAGTLPNNNDTDADDVSDYLEVKVYFSDPLKVDTDDDGIEDGIEINDLGSNPNSNDTDSDGMRDWYEWVYNLKILQNDSTEDPDGDGLWNIYEHEWNINPNKPDHDDDGLNDGDEVLVWGTHPNVRDTDLDSIWDGTEVHTYGTDPLKKDTDDDFINDWIEITNGLDPLDNDTDNDLMLDGYEWQFGLQPLNNSDAILDYDGDGLTNYEESLYWSNPFSADSDDDHLSDDFEVGIGTNPILEDSDGDGLDDYLEVMILQSNATNVDTDFDNLTDGDEYLIYFSDLLNPDTDGDGINDGDEVHIYGTNPTEIDSDGDELDDGDEISLGTNPLEKDTDQDGMTDGWEVLYDLNPLVDDSSGDADDDNVPNLTEYQFSSNPRMNDTDLDGLSDYQEIFVFKTSPVSNDTDADDLNDYDELFVYGTSPFDQDSDDDRLLDGEEVLIGTNPTLFDTDEDGVGDGQEVKDGTNPLNARDNSFINIRNFVLILAICCITSLVLYYLSPALITKIRRRFVQIMD